ncbi:hypothetical protein AWB92_25340 [Mycobacterium sp. IEC1808]|nr:hypothetical protein AWB92_25340 [Mycobacterium sp. IEC1808]
MSPKKLHTRQYCGTGRSATRAITTAAAVGLAAWFGTGFAHSDTNREREACALMDDHADAMIQGYSSYAGQYAFVVLSKEMPPLDAAHVLKAATIDVCPNHAGDLPVDWQ